MIRLFHSKRNLYDLARVIRIGSRGIYYLWIYATGLASLQTEECQGDKYDIYFIVPGRNNMLAYLRNTIEFAARNSLEFHNIMPGNCHVVCQDKIWQDLGYQSNRET